MSQTHANDTLFSSVELVDRPLGHSTGPGMAHAAQCARTGERHISVRYDSTINGKMPAISN